MRVQKFEACKSADSRCIRNPNVPDGQRHTLVETRAERDRLVDQINAAIAAAARSGSPEGWPEGADAEGAELVPACNLYDDINVWQRWSSLGGWEDLNYDVWKYVPGDVVVVARRKPKPATRLVTLWDLKPGMRIASESDRIEVVREVVRVETADTRLVTILDTTGASPFVRSAGSWPVAVLVEDPNG